LCAGPRKLKSRKLSVVCSGAFLSIKKDDWGGGPWTGKKQSRQLETLKRETSSRHKVEKVKNLLLRVQNAKRENLKVRNMQKRYQSLNQKGSEVQPKKRGSGPSDSE